MYGQGGELLSGRNAENQRGGEIVRKEHLFAKLKSKCQ